MNPSPTPDAASPPAPAALPPAEWPAWVRAADRLIALLAVAVAFVLAGHTARNTDVWPHLAAGRLVAQGNYAFGTDPFGFTTAGRTWVNHSWLLDLGSYVVYTADPTGAYLVGLKAAVFAAAFALIFLLRRPGDPLWPWAVTVFVAAIAAGPHYASGLRPLVVSAFLLSVVQVILFRLEWKPNSWRNPLLLAGVCWVWANVDAWFVLGPAVIAVTLLGEWAQATLLKGTDAGDDGPPLPIPGLAKAVGLAVVACMLNPHHVNVWRLPVEVAPGLSAAARNDPSLRVLSLRPLADTFHSQPEFGYGPHGLAFAALLAGGAVVLAVGFTRLRLSQIALWLLFAGLGLAHFRLVVLFAVVCAPLVAAGLAGLARGVTLGPRDKPRTQLLLIASGVGRLLAVSAAVLLVLAAYPGWLHPRPIDPAYGYRFAPAVEPDPGLARTAAVIQGWRTAGVLADDVRGLHLNPQLGDHLTWFSPAEKAFVTTRYAFHADELDDFLRAREAATGRTDGKIEPAVVAEVADKYKAGYAATASAGTPPTTVNAAAAFDLARVGDEFNLWHLDGRSIVVGRRAISGPSFDPVRLAFAPDLEPLPEPILAPPPAAETEPTIVEQFLDRPKPTPLAGLDAAVWHEFAQIDVQIRTQTLPYSGSAVGGVLGLSPFIAVNRLPPAAATDFDIGLQLLAVRAARRAQAANPDYPDTYRVLAGTAGAGPGESLTLPGTDAGEADEQFTVAARAYLDRVPPPNRVGNDQIAALLAGFAGRLGESFARKQIVDAGRRYAVLSGDYQKQILRIRVARGQMEQKQADEAIKGIDARGEPIQAELSRRLDALAQQPAQGGFQQGMFAARLGLLEEAAKLFAQADPPDPPSKAALVITMADTHLRLGRPDLAEQVLSAGYPALKAAAEGADQQGARTIIQNYDALRATVFRLTGYYAKYGEAVESDIAARAGELPADARRMVTAAVASPAAWLTTLSGLGAGAAGGGTAILVAQPVANGTLNAWLTDARFFLTRGRLSLLEGKMADAKTRFTQAVRPQGIEVPAFAAERQVADRYLRLIAAGEGK